MEGPFTGSQKKVKWGQSGSSFMPKYDTLVCVWATPPPCEDYPKLTTSYDSYPHPAPPDCASTILTSLPMKIIPTQSHFVVYGSQLPLPNEHYPYLAPLFEFGPQLPLPMRIFTTWPPPSCVWIIPTPYLCFTWLCLDHTYPPPPPPPPH